MKLFIVHINVQYAFIITPAGQVPGASALSPVHHTDANISIMIMTLLIVTSVTSYNIIRYIYDKLSHDYNIYIYNIYITLFVKKWLHFVT